MSNSMPNEPYVIVGGGHAARRAAESLREHDSQARIVVLGAEPDLPYDRPVLSKDALLGEDGERRAFIRDAAWYADQRIEMRLGVHVGSIDRSANTVRLADGTVVPYAKLLLATGSRVRKLGLPVDDGVDVHYVRTVADARALRAALSAGKRVSVLGGGFIGLEVAASAATLGCNVTLIEPAPALLQRAMPAEIGQYVHALHTRHGVDIRLDTRPQAIRHATHGAVIETDRGEYEADIVVAGIGVIPNVELAEEAGLEVRNGIVVDAQCRTADGSIFAAGEVTSHFNPLLARHIRVESWQVAENQPAVAAVNMLGGDLTYSEMPWLWSDQYDCNLQTLGVFEAGQTIVVRGKPSDGTFCVLALDEARTLAAVAAVSAGREIGVCKRLMAGSKALDADKLADPAIALRSML